MSRLLQTDANQVKDFVYERVHEHPGFKGDVLDVSVDRYPGDFFVTIWVRQEPEAHQRQYVHSIEAELGNLGVTCSIVVKTDRELSLGGIQQLRTQAGDVSFRFYQIDRIKDEDVVYVYVLHQGHKTFRFRLSLSGTLASMLRSRNRLQARRIEEVYLSWIKTEIETGKLGDGEIREFMFTSSDLARFVGPE